MISLRRLEALADAVFAIVMTLLALELRVPPNPGRGLIEALAHLYPVLMAYVLAFILLGTAWVSHHGQLHHMTHTNRDGLWLHIIFLMAVSLLPFGSSLLAHHPFDRISVWIFGGIVMFSFLMLVVIWKHARKIGAANCSPEACAIIEAHAKVAVWIYAAGMILTLWSQTVALATFLLVPLIYLIPWRNHHGRG